MIKEEAREESKNKKIGSDPVNSNLVSGKLLLLESHYKQSATEKELLKSNYRSIE